jgi:ABC-2 type transport system ATP-binding protein
MSEQAAAIVRRIDRQERPLQARVTPLPSQALFSLRGVWRYWGRGRRRWAVLRDISLEIGPGTAVGLSGRNGAGKTTLLRVAAGLLAPDSGTVVADGLSPYHSWREYHRCIGFLSAGDRGLYARVSVRGHLDFAARLGFVPRAQRELAIADAMQLFALGELSDRRADRLSQGQRQRLRFALALVHRPRLLLLDEPCASLDDEGHRLVQRAIRELLERGGAVLCCAPAGDEAAYPFDRTFVIEDGELAPG